MNIVHYIPTQFPIKGRHGGNYRVPYWLGKAQAEMGHQVSYLCKKKSSLPFAETIEAPEKFDDLTPFIPPKTDIVQLYDVFPVSKTHTLDDLSIDSLPTNAQQFKIDYPFLVCLQGNGRASEVFHPNTVFVSSNHAARHNWTEYVCNGIDILEYPLKKEKENFLLFLALTYRRVKNLFGSIAIANKARIPLHIGGGKAPFWSRGIVSHGLVDGNKKLSLLQNAQALLFPIIYDEPFGLSAIEALACGTPVIAAPRGALPEIIDPDCGILASSFDEFIEATKKVHDFDPEACRNRVLQKFTHIHMAEKYLYYYSKILRDGYLREGYPVAEEKPKKVIYYKQPMHHYIGNLAASTYIKFRWKETIN